MKIPLLLSFGTLLTDIWEVRPIVYKLFFKYTVTNTSWVWLLFSYLHYYPPNLRCHHLSPGQCWDLLTCIPAPILVNYISQPSFSSFSTPRLLLPQCLCSLLGIVFLPLLPNYPYLIAFLLQLNHNFFRELQFFLICQSRSGNHIPYGTPTFPSQCLSQFIEIQLSDQINSCLIHWTKNSMKVMMESLLFKDLSLVPVTVPCTQ